MSPQLALTHSFGGPHGPEKLRWLEGVLGDFLQRNGEGGGGRSAPLMAPLLPH